jgi:hypothetical protein
MADNQILVTKASGEQESFLVDKLRGSLERAGARPEIIDEIVKDILSWAHDGISTKKIYDRAFAMLRKQKAGPALKYKLKHAIMELGPTGYPFEQFVGMIYRRLGYSVQVGITIDGHCVTHEMDVIATGNSQQVLVECKYGQDQGKHVSVQVPLYVRSRVDDIIRKRNEMPEFSGLTFRGAIYTNTRFTSESVQYGKCSGLELVGWDYPNGKGLKDLIEELQVYPITILNNLGSKEKHVLMQQDVVTCAFLLKNKENLEQFGFSAKKMNSIIRELEDICI